MDRVRRQLGLINDFETEKARTSVSVAVLDSGITYHPDLREQILAFRDFSGRRMQRSRLHYFHTPYDEHGHGTHVSGIICGTGRVSLGRYQGICPGAKIIMAKVLDERGDGSADRRL